MPLPALGLPANNQAQPEPDILSDLIAQRQGRLTGLENQGEDPRIAQLMEAVQASQQPVGLNTSEKILTALNSVAFLADRFSKKPRGRSAPQKFAQNLQGIQAGPQGRKQAQQQKLQSELFVQDFLGDITREKKTDVSRARDNLTRLIGEKRRGEEFDKRLKASKEEFAALQASKNLEPDVFGDMAAREKEVRGSIMAIYKDKLALAETPQEVATLLDTINTLVQWQLGRGPRPAAAGETTDDEETPQSDASKMAGELFDALVDPKTYKISTTPGTTQRPQQ